MTTTTPASPVRRQRGSFVLEALISLLLFAVALMGLMSLAAQGLNQVGQSKARNDASYVVGELLSEMWVSANVNIETWAGRLSTSIPNATGTVYLSNCDCVATVTNVCTGPVTGTVAIANPQAVTVCVSWTDTKDASNPRRYQASSMITRN